MIEKICDNCKYYDPYSLVEGYCGLYGIIVSYNHDCFNFELNEKKIIAIEHFNNKLNKAKEGCHKCKYCERVDKNTGYWCMIRKSFILAMGNHCSKFSKKDESESDNMNEEKTLLCDNCRFAEFKDNNDNFYCALYDQPIYADPHHLVCDHHSDHYKGFDSPRYVR